MLPQTTLPNFVLNYFTLTSTVNINIVESSQGQTKLDRWKSTNNTRPTLPSTTNIQSRSVQQGNQQQKSEEEEKEEEDEEEEEDARRASICSDGRMNMGERVHVVEARCGQYGNLPGQWVSCRRICGFSGKIIQRGSVRGGSINPDCRRWSHLWNVGTMPRPRHRCLVVKVHRRGYVNRRTVPRCPSVEPTYPRQWVKEPLDRLDTL